MIRDQFGRAGSLRRKVLVVFGAAALIAGLAAFA